MKGRTIGIVGAGRMGCGITQVAAQSGYDVVLTDIDAAILEQGLSSVGRGLDRLVDRGSMTAEQRATAFGRIRTSTNVTAHVDAELVIETAIERFEIKAEIFRQLDDACPDTTVFASNTSSISITRLGTATGRPERVVGMHFMNPAQLMRLVEVIRGLDTADQAVELVKETALGMGKTPVECNDQPGFVSNRLLMPMINEAIYAVSEGVATPTAVDEIMTLGMNHPMGPLALADLIGLDSCLSVMRTLHAELGDPKYRPCPLLIRMVDAGRLGRRTGRGFYDYTED
jgi:3-hydroxybutyryl-CoA dehydrogenase